MGAAARLAQHRGSFSSLYSSQVRSLACRSIRLTQRDEHVATATMDEQLIKNTSQLTVTLVHSDPAECHSQLSVAAKRALPSCELPLIGRLNSHPPSDDACIRIGTEATTLTAFLSVLKLPQLASLCRISSDMQVNAPPPTPLFVLRGHRAPIHSLAFHHAAPPSAAAAAHAAPSSALAIARPALSSRGPSSLLLSGDAQGQVMAVSRHCDRQQRSAHPFVAHAHGLTLPCPLLSTVLRSGIWRLVAAWPPSPRIPARQCSRCRV